MTQKSNDMLARRALAADIKKYMKQELCRTTDAETYRQNNQYDFNNLYYRVAARAHSTS